MGVPLYLHRETLAAIKPGPEALAFESVDQLARLKGPELVRAAGAAGVPVQVQAGRWPKESKIHVAARVWAKWTGVWPDAVPRPRGDRRPRYRVSGMLERAAAQGLDGYGRLVARELARVAASSRDRMIGDPELARVRSSPQLERALAEVAGGMQRKITDKWIQFLKRHRFLEVGRQWT